MSQFYEETVGRDMAWQLRKHTALPEDSDWFLESTYSSLPISPTLKGDPMLSGLHGHLCGTHIFMQVDQYTQIK